MPDLVLILTDQHNADVLAALLPHGCVSVGIRLTREEWHTAATDHTALRVLGPMLAEAKRRWPETRMYA